MNSGYADLAIVAAVLRDQTISDNLVMTVTPGSRQILDTIAQTGVYRDLVRAGARMLEPACGPCVGMGQAPPSGSVSVRTFNRNFPGHRRRQRLTRGDYRDLKIPKLREGPYFPSFLEPRRRAERALLAVIQQAYIEGISTRKVDDLVQALGLSGIDKSTVSRICQELDTAVTPSAPGRSMASIRMSGSMHSTSKSAKIIGSSRWPWSSPLA